MPGRRRTAAARHRPAVLRCSSHGRSRAIPAPGQDHAKGRTHQGYPRSDSGRGHEARVERARRGVAAGGGERGAEDRHTERAAELAHRGERARRRADVGGGTVLVTDLVTAGMASPNPHRTCSSARPASSSWHRALLSRRSRPSRRPAPAARSPPARSPIRSASAPARGAIRNGAIPQGAGGGRRGAGLAPHHLLELRHQEDRTGQRCVEHEDRGVARRESAGPEQARRKHRTGGPALPGREGERGQRPRRPACRSISKLLQPAEFPRTSPHTRPSAAVVTSTSPGRSTVPPARARCLGSGPGPAGRPPARSAR